MKPIIAFDFDGTIISSAAGREADHEWYRVMSILLNKPEIRNLAGKKAYFRDVLRLMEQYTGLRQSRQSDKRTMTRLARNLYQFSFLGSAYRHRSDLLIPRVKPLISGLKRKFLVALVTTTPTDIVVPLLSIAKIKDVFDIVFTQSLEQQPSKRKLLGQFVQKYKKPICSIGNSAEDMEASRQLGIMGVLVKWDKYEKEAEKSAAYVVSSVDELKSLLDTNVLK